MANSIEPTRVKRGLVLHRHFPCGSCMAFIFYSAHRTETGQKTAKERIFMPRLTKQEQQEILRFIEADRPLPDKYRFLLFEDKREVEVWNGKSARRAK